MSIRHALFSTILLATAVVVGAQEEYPSQARGVSADSAYQIGDLDTVNLFNGNLTLAIPIGPTFAGDGALQWGLNLVYNSTAWDFEDETCTKDLIDGPGENFGIVHYGKAVPNQVANAGIGWELSLGRLLQPTDDFFHPTALRPFRWTYVSPDGARHVLADSLHDHDAHAGEAYSNDGSYLRMRVLAGAGCPAPPTVLGSVGCRIVDSPNGIERVFFDFDAVTPGLEPNWRLTQMRDAFGNALEIEYTSHTWTLKDAYRTVTVTFRATNTAFHFATVEEVEVPIFGGQAATYDFLYDHTVIERHRFDTVRDLCDLWGDDVSPEPDANVTVDLLTGINFPDGSFHAMAYDRMDGTNLKSGALTKMRLLTGVWYHWTYGPYEFYYERPPGLEIGNFDVNVTHGVVRKDRFDNAQGTGAPLGTWTYIRGVGGFDPPLQDTVGGCYQTNTVRDPLGNETVHYFNTNNRVNRTEHGLPFTRCLPRCPDDGTTCDLAAALASTCPAHLTSRGCDFLSKEVFAGNIDSGRVLVRSHYLTYANDGPSASTERNNRIVYEATVYHDDQARDGAGDELFTDLNYANDDGFGHFRGTSVGSNFPDGDGDRTTTTNYLPAGTSASFTLPPLASRWLFGTYDSITVTESPGNQARVDYCFDGRGFLLGRRQVTNPSTDDLLVQFDEEIGNSNGNVAAERYYGGDGAGLGAGCSNNHGTPAHKQVHTYAGGVRQSTKWVNDAGSSVLLPLDLDIDIPSGLASASRDVAGIATTFAYDAVGRLTEERPADSAWMRHSYQFPTVGNPTAGVTYTAERCRRGTTDCTLTRDHHVYDVLGRLTSSSRKVPLDQGGTETSRSFTYNQVGWPLATSVWGLPAATTYHDYDRFGRAGRIVAPDGSVSTIVFQGVREVATSVDVAGANGTLTRTVTQRRDGQGRLARLIEPAGTNGTDLVTRYDYDEGDRVALVCNGEQGDGSCHQQRSFIYDDRGLLRSENRPESTIINYTYDALGNVVTRRQGTDTNRHFAIDLRYGPAGRLTQVLGFTGAAGNSRLLRELFYARGSENGSLGKGKLAVAKGHNYGPDPANPGGERDVVVTELFRYQAQDGRLSQRTQRASNGVSFSLQVPSYDPLGNPLQLRYPACATGTGCESWTVRTVNAGYTHGYLTSLPGYATSLTYHGDAQVSRLAHANNVTDVYSRGNDGRLSSLGTQGVASGNWLSGGFSYDPAGNITAIGGEFFAYDRANRLVAATVDTDRSAGTTLRSRTFTYDPYGNLASINGDGAPVGAIGHDDATNRLTAGGATYDLAGHLTRIDPGGGPFDYAFDALDRLTSLAGPGGDRGYLYTASGERLATIDLDTGIETWTPRGPSNEVLRRVERAHGSWTQDRDYIYAGTRLVATASPGMPETVRHTTLDHLGSTRLITDEGANQVAFHTYYPYGQNAEEPVASTEPIQFTGHERDDNGPGLNGDLDYMHARYYTSRFGRFLSVDPARGRKNEAGSWNSYRYAGNNPLANLDPDGREEAQWQQSLRLGLRAAAGRLQRARSVLSVRHAAAVNNLNSHLNQIPRLDRIAIQLRNKLGQFAGRTTAAAGSKVQAEIAEAAVTRLAPKVALSQLAARASLAGAAVEFIASTEIEKFAERQDREIAYLTSATGPDAPAAGYGFFLGVGLSNAEAAEFQRLLASGDQSEIEAFREGIRQTIRVADDASPSSRPGGTPNDNE